MAPRPRARTSRTDWVRSSCQGCFKLESARACRSESASCHLRGMLEGEWARESIRSSNVFSSPTTVLTLPREARQAQGIDRLIDYNIWVSSCRARWVGGEGRKETGLTWSGGSRCGKRGEEECGGLRQRTASQREQSGARGEEGIAACHGRVKRRREATERTVPRTGSGGWRASRGKGRRRC